MSALWNMAGRVAQTSDLGSIADYRLLAETGPKLTDRFWKTRAFNTSIGNGRNVPRPAFNHILLPPRLTALGPCADRQ